MPNKNSFDFYSLWEELFNPNFNSVESHRIKNEEVGYNSFTMTSKQWKEKNPNLKGNIRDNTDITHLIVLSNLEVLNSSMINDNIKQNIRIDKLNKEARKQLTILYENNNIKKIDLIEKNTE